VLGLDFLPLLAPLERLLMESSSTTAFGTIVANPGGGRYPAQVARVARVAQVARWAAAAGRGGRKFR
jgi:hypothetical protein